jgi:hypothetical protein
MIPIPSGVRVWPATGHTDSHLIKVLWHDGIGMSLYAKRLGRRRPGPPAPKPWWRI